MRSGRRGGTLPDSITTLVVEDPRARTTRLAVGVVVAAAAAWTIGAVADAWSTDGGRLVDALLRPGPAHLWMRALTAALLLLVWHARREALRLRLLSTALAEAPDGVQIATLDGRVAWSNAAVQRIYGFSPAELHGRPVDSMNADPAFASREILPALRATGRWTGELEVKHKDGHTFPIWLATAVVLSARRTPIAAVGIIRDVTERKRAEEALRRYAHRLEEATRLKDLFADVLRHDVLGPGTALQLTLGTLRRQGLASEHGPRLLDAALRSCARLVEMVERAAAYAKLSEPAEVALGRLELGAALREVVGDFEPALHARSASVELRADGAYPARASPLVSQVFANLLSNAIKYGPEGGTIRVAVEDLGDRWKVAVADRGEGVPDADKERVFARFERLAREGPKGSGLGLAIAKRIMDLHAGAIWVEDNPGGGSVFCAALAKDP